jgi:hypothetical protein
MPIFVTAPKVSSHLSSAWKPATSVAKLARRRIRRSLSVRSPDGDPHVNVHRSVDSVADLVSDALENGY